MPKVNNAGYSETTKRKYRQFEYLINVHVVITKKIIEKHLWTSREYFFVDMNAGPGILDNKKGSPVLFMDAAKKARIDFEAYFIDICQENIKSLREIFDGEKCEILQVDNEKFLLDQAKQPMEKRKYGLIYADPNGIANFDLLGEFFQHSKFSCIDVAINCNATAIKRLKKFKLEDCISKINKKHWMLCEPASAHQWTILVGTNWINFPTFEKIGFYRINTKEGQEFFRKANFTKAELAERYLKGKN